MIDDLTVQEQCDRCKEPITLLVKDFEQRMKDGDPILCPDCHIKSVDEETEAMPKRCFEYKVCSIGDIIINDLGIDGWELVSVDNGQAYFKREKFEVAND